MGDKQYSLFTDEETNPNRFNNLPVITYVQRNKARVQDHALTPNSIILPHYSILSLFSKLNLSLMMRSGKMHSDFQPSDLEKTLKYIVLQLDYLHANLRRFSKILY